ncbi:MAG: hypothetical protein EOM37_05045 [Proteobacteria bacterium]|nr:hypothetical protein [Pseudomonadota bacterium]
MSLYSASAFDSTTLNTAAATGSLIYQRDVSLPLNSTLEDAADLGSLIYNKTQLAITGQISRENSTHFYKFSLDGNNIKLNFTNSTSSADLKVQILNSSGKVIADSSKYADQALQDAYKKMVSSDGYEGEAGDYYVKTTFDSMAKRSVAQTYSVTLYSGTRFTNSYQTTGKAQTKTTQKVLIDNTMTYSLLDAKAYETKATHIANETPLEAINIGWIYENKTALSVSSQITDVCDTQYYLFTLQKGEGFKMAFNNKTDTSDIRVQIMDPTGTVVFADSHGTEAQKEAYAKLTSSEGLTAKDAAQYLIKVEYAQGEDKNKQIYGFKIYTGTTYDAMYETTVGTESIGTAIATGHFQQKFSMTEAAANYLTAMFNGDELNIMDELKTI